MGFFRRLFRPVKNLVDKVIDTVTDVAKAAVDVVASPFKMPSMGDIGGFDTTQGQVDNDILGPLLNKDSGVGNIPVVYGERRIGGHRVFISTNGSSNQYLYVAIALCEGQVNSIDKIFIDDVDVPMSSYAHGVEATPSSGDYVDRLKTQFFDGRDDQTVSSLLDEAPGWGSNHRLRGVAYLACRFEWKKVETQEDADNNPYRSGVPKVQVRLKGRKIFDIVSGYTQAYQGSISGTSGSGTRTNTATTASITQTTNPPTANYSNTITFATTESGAIFKSKVDATVESRAPSTMYSNTGGSSGFFFKNPTSLVQVHTQQEFQAVKVRQILTNTDTSTVISDITDGPISSTNGVKVTAVIDQNYSVPTANYTLETQIILTGNGPQIGIPTGTYNVTGEIGVSGTTTNNTAYASETVTYDNNPVNVLVDYLRNPRYGKGLSNDSFDWNSVRLAAQQCNQIVPYTSSTTGKFSEFDGIIDTGSTLLNNVKNILMSFNGIMPYMAGKYHIKLHHGGNLADIDAAPNPPPVVMTINEDILIGGLQIQGESKQRKINQLRVTYTDPDADYQPNDAFYPETSSSTYTTYLNEDNNIPLHKQIALPHCIHRERALNYAETIVKTSRNKMILRFSTTTAATDVSVGDLVRIINRNLNFDGFFRIESVSLSGEGSLNFTATEHNPNDYVLDGQPAAAAKPSINLPNPLLVTAPTNLAVAQTTSLSSSGYTASPQLNITYTASTDPFTTEYIIQVKRASDSTFITVGITNATQFLYGPVASGDQWDVRVAARNELDRRSNFATVATYTVT